MSIGKVTLVAVLIIVVGILIGMSFDYTVLGMGMVIVGLVAAISWVSGVALFSLTKSTPPPDNDDH